MSVGHSWQHAIVTTMLYRFWISKVDARHASGLFTIQCELEDLPSRLGRIFLVAVTKDDRLPAYVCQSCRDKASSVEKRLKDLQNLKNLVMDRIVESIPRRLVAGCLAVSPQMDQLVLQLRS